MGYKTKERYRKSIRLKGYDYSKPGAYFITLCTSDHQCSLGRMENDRIKLLPVGEMVTKFWNEIPQHFEQVELDEYIIMPNHIHGILIIKKYNQVGVQNFEPLHDPNHRQINRYQHVIPHSIGSIVRSIKSAVTHWCRQNGFPNFRWQRNYYDHIIRDEKELDRIRKYIKQNPKKWQIDDDHPKCWK